MPHADPTLSVAERVDAACDRFESEWKAGRRPRIDDYLAAAPESDREELRSALLAIELELQGRGAADTSVTRSSVRSDGQPTPITTIDHIRNAEASRREIGRFEIRGVLGSGAFGKVYRAYDPHLGREVAVKVPLESTVKTDAERAQFLKEARAAATINHPNVCQVHEVGEADGRPYIVMAMVPGQSLADTLKTRKGPLPEKQAALIARKIAVALAAAHDKGIVHRDLKPANVMFDRERKDIVVMDFGLARGPRFGDARGTQSGIVMGTPAYMSPEQARGESKEVGPAGDVFSLGVIFYELLTGARPFSGTATEVIGQILHIDPEPPSKRRSGIDPRLEAICLKAMAKDPAARFATMKEFAAELEAVVRTPVPVAETMRPDQTHRTGDEPGTSTNMAEVFAAISADREQTRAETAAAVEAAVAKHRTPRWVFVLAGLLLMGGLAAVAGIVFYTRSDKVKVTIELTDVDLGDKSLSFFLDEEPISAEALANPVELTPGEHVLVVKRGKAIVKRMLLTVSGGRSPGIRMRDITPLPPPPIPPVEQDFIPLFNGKDLTGWSTLNLNSTKNKTKSVWAADPERQVLAAVAGDFQELQSDRRFKDFTLRLEWRFTPGRSVGVNGSGIVVRSKGLNLTGPLAGADPQGIEIDLRPKSSQSDDKSMGTGCFTTYGSTLANHRGKTKGDTQRHLGWLKEPAIHYDGEWNSCEVTCQGDRIKVSMNGDLINEGWDADQSAGRIVLRSQNTAVEFRNIRIKELEEGFAPLFNGKDLTGWQPTPGSKADWRIEGGAIVAGSAAFNPGERSYLMTTRDDYADFRLRIEAMLDATADSGAFVRLQPFTQQGVSGHERGYEVQMNCEVRDTNRTGGLSVAPPAGGPVLAHRQEQGLAAAGEWFTLEIEARGARITTRVNGVVAADYTDPDRHYARGHIALQYTRGLVKVRKVEVKKLPPAGAFVPLFNGKDFAGWTNTGETAVTRGWVVKDGAIVRDKANPIDEDGREWFKNNLWTKEQYDDFVLELEFRGSGTNTLVIRADQPGHQFVDHGLHVPMNLPGTTGNYWQLGSFYPFQSPEKAARLQEDRNQLRLTAAGPNITVEVNGETINVIDLDQWGSANEGKVDAGMLSILRSLSRKGHIGFHAREGEISLRNVRVKKLTSAK